MFVLAQFCKLDLSLESEITSLFYLHICLFYHGATAPLGQGLLIIEDLWSYSDTPHSVGLLWKRDQTDAETSIRQRTKQSQETNIHDPAGFEPTIPASEWPQTHALDYGATGTGAYLVLMLLKLRDLGVL